MGSKVVTFDDPHRWLALVATLGTQQRAGSPTPGSPANPQTSSGGGGVSDEASTRQPGSASGARAAAVPRLTRVPYANWRFRQARRWACGVAVTCRVESLAVRARPQLLPSAAALPRCPSPCRSPPIAPTGGLARLLVLAAHGSLVCRRASGRRRRGAPADSATTQVRQRPTRSSPS
jgi:hypothetical protein